MFAKGGQTLVITAVLLVALFGVAKYGYRLMTLCSPQKRMQKAANGILDALIRIRRLEEPLHCRAVVEQADVLPTLSAA